MHARPAEELARYLDRLAELPFVDDLRLEEPDERREGHVWDARLELRASGRRYRFHVVHQRAARLNYALVEAMLGRAPRDAKARWILFTPHVTPPMAAHLQKRGVNYVDASGNCHVALDRTHVAVIDGRRPAHRLEDARMVGPAGYRVLFALLARPRLVDATVREIAAAAGVGKTIVAVVLRRLEQEGLLARTGTRTILTRPAALLDRWLAGYVDMLRPRLLIGAYQAPMRDPDELEGHIEHVLLGAGPREHDARKRRGATADEGIRWAWGGGTAAYRLTGHFRGEQVVLHVAHLPDPLVRQLRLLPAQHGRIVVMKAPGPLGFEGAAPRIADPLLVYTELLATGDERAREAATEIRDRFLGHLQ